jgi:hypothetical protein
MIMIKIRSIVPPLRFPKPFWRGSRIVHHTISDNTEPVDRLIGKRVVIKRDPDLVPFAAPNTGRPVAIIDDREAVLSQTGLRNGTNAAAP